jgi:hypothetical protein
MYSASMRAAVSWAKETEAMPPVPVRAGAYTGRPDNCLCGRSGSSSAGSTTASPSTS